MSSAKFSEEFKRDSVAQITERGCAVSEVAERLGVGQYSLYSWKKKFANASFGDVEKDAEIRRRKNELVRVFIDKGRELPFLSPRAHDLEA